MKETLILPATKFPGAFSAGTVSTSVYERKIIDTINTRGHGRCVEDIRYLDLKSLFPHFDKFKSNAVGAICETIPLGDISNLKSNDYVWNEEVGGELYQHRIRAFVVITDTEIKSRNNYVAQSLFPFLFAQLEAGLSSSCLLLSTKPIYLVCLLDDNKALPPSTERDFKFASAAGIRVLAPMRQTPVAPQRRINISELSVIQPRDPYFSIDSARKVFTVESKGLNSILNGNNEIHGSNEKFGMMLLVPSAIVAVRCGYSFDIAEFELWLAKLGTPGAKGKIASLHSVGKYLRKLAK